MDNIKTWTGLPVEQSIRTTEDGDKRRKYVHGVAHRGWLKNRTDQRPVRCYYLLLLDSQFLFTNRRKANASLRAFSRIWHATKDDLDGAERKCVGTKGNFLRSPKIHRSILKIFFTVGLSRKFATKSYVNTPSHPKSVATLPCEIFVFKKSQFLSSK